MELREVRVTNLYVSCSFPMRTTNAMALSDCCRKYAHTAVEHPSGNMYYRCDEHRGMIDANTTGPVHETILTEISTDNRIITI